jgi:hypothetical protein
VSENSERVVDGRAWRAFCSALAAAGETLLRAGTPATAFDRAEGMRYLTRLLRAALEKEIEHGDPRFPAFYQLSNETIKIGNDNPDNVYHNSTISGRYDYRISGTRGTVPTISFGTKRGGYDTTGTMEPTGQLDGRTLRSEADGSFEILVSAKPQLGNWLPMAPDTSMLIVRQTFTDKQSQTPATYRIECLNRNGEDRIDPETLEAKLLRSVDFVRGTADLFVDWMNLYASHLNQLPSDDQKRCQDAGGDANIHYLQSYWKLAPNEALLIEPTRIPDCEFWNLQISNYWMESLDYRRHRICINGHQCKREADGRIRIVLAHQNPGPRYPNWLETAGHGEGGMLWRWVGAREYPPVETRVVDFSAL